jgi:hypothetical protein
MKDLHNYVIDRNVNQFNKKSNKSHNREPNGCRHRYLLKLYLHPINY